MLSCVPRLVRFAPCASLLLACAAAPAVFAQSSASPISPAPAGVELSRREETVYGRQFILIRALPPAASATPSFSAATASPPPAPAPSYEDVRRAAKRHATFSVVATVYAGSPVFTELRWTAAGREWLAYSNVDFRALTQLPWIETDDTVYQWFPLVVTGDVESRPAPSGLVFADEGADYYVLAGRAEWQAAPEAFVALDWLHAYYEVHRARLDADLARRLAEQARRAAEPPPPPKPRVVRYYVPAPAAAEKGAAR